MIISRQNSLKRGFTLAESVIALGILVVLITGFLAVFGPAATAIRKTLSAEDASRLQSALEVEMSTIREGREEQLFDEPLAKAFDWITRSHERGGTVFLYRYRGDIAESRPDGTLQPRTDVSGVAGQDYMIQSMVRRIDDPLIEEDFEALVGRVFFVKLSQLVFNREGLSVVEEPDKIVDPHKQADDYTTNVDEFPEATVLFEAQFF
ncbi:type II secretion system GspH family protein, partial [Akkermansiaceae bacterium]|nr:type II secretion system GspH family protein [Akkermansiaceae bacterium]MDB4301847.1 type II secretion system GspH family protein [Akkermansiaceae bacterium]